MGKRYYCNYCDKIMVASPSIVKTHNSGLVHQQLIKQHYQQFKDIETIYKEERLKKPCSRFASGHCKFELVCHYSHYTKEQMQEFEQYLAEKNRSLWSTNQPSFEELYKKLQDTKSTEKNEKEGQIILDPNGMSHVLPWSYKGDSESEHITPSLRRLEFEHFQNVQLVEWGTIN